MNEGKKSTPKRVSTLWRRKRLDVAIVGTPKHECDRTCPSKLLTPSTRLFNIHIVLFMNGAQLPRRSPSLPSCAVVRPSAGALFPSQPSHCFPEQPHMHVTTHLSARRDCTWMFVVVHDEDASNSRCPHAASPLCPLLVPLGRRSVTGRMRQPPDHHPRWSHRRFSSPLHFRITTHRYFLSAYAEHRKSHRHRQKPKTLVCIHNSSSYIH